MNEREQLQNFINQYITLRKKQTDYFKFKSTNTLKDCKLLESRLDALAQKIMIDLDMNFSLAPEQPKLF